MPGVIELTEAEIIVLKMDISFRKNYTVNHLDTVAASVPDPILSDMSLVCQRDRQGQSVSL